MKKKTIAIVGRARLGKSFITAMFSENTAKYREIFCANSDDKTACPVHNKIIMKKDTPEDFETSIGIEFCSNFYEIHKDEKENPEVAEILQDLNNLKSNLYVTEHDDKSRYNISFSEDEGVLKDIVADFETISKKIIKFESDNNEHKVSDTHFDVYLRPSEFGEEIMRDVDLEEIEILDTPGVSGNVKFSHIRADLYIFILKADNKDEAQTLKDIVEKVKHSIASASVCFLYKKELALDEVEEEKDYEAQTAQIQNDMKPFESIFEELRKSIISSEMELLYPAKNALLLPTMSTKNNNHIMNKCFRKSLKNKIVSAFNKDNNYNIGAIEVITEETEKQFILKLLKEIPAHRVQPRDISYTLSTFKEEWHGRTKTADYAWLLTEMYDAYAIEKKLLYNYFNKFLPNDYSVRYAEIIRALFVLLDKAISRDDGLLQSNHWKEYPVTMWIEEAILAPEIYNLKEINLNTLRAVFSNYNINGSWMFVRYRECNELIKRIEIITKSLCRQKVYSLKDIILYRYIGGFRKLAEYNILLKNLKLSEEEALKRTLELVF